MNIDISKFILPSEPFSGFSSSYSEAKYVVIGFPFDLTSTYRLGSSKAPQAIREASINIETNSRRTDLYIEDLKICDLGDLSTSQSLESALIQLKLLVNQIVEVGKIPIVLGGEHTLTYAIAQTLQERMGILSFDAHFDLRDEYRGLRLSHTTFMRRTAELLGAERVFHVGVRAYCKEELQYALSQGINYLTARELRNKGLFEAVSVTRSFIRVLPAYHLTIDMDVLNPACAPGVGNPEPEGVDLVLLLDLLHNLQADGRIVSMDLVEVNPDYDHGETAVQAAHIIFEVLCSIEKERSRQRRLY